jgi:hypothetical protein
MNENQNDIETKTIELSQTISTEYTRAIAANNEQSSNVITMNSNILYNDEQFSLHVSEIKEKHNNERELFSVNTNNTLSYIDNATNNNSNNLITLMENDVVENDLLSSQLESEKARAVSNENVINSNLVTVTEHENSTHTSFSSNLYEEIQRGNSNNTTISNTLSNEIVDATNTYNELNSSIESAKNLANTQSTSLTNDYTSHEENLDSKHGLITSNIESTQNENHSKLGANGEFNTMTNEESNRIENKKHGLENELSTTKSTTIANSLLRMNTNGDVVQANVKVNGNVYLGPHWRISESEDSATIAFEYYNSTTHSWIPTIPFSFTPAFV